MRRTEREEMDSRPKFFVRIISGAVIAGAAPITLALFKVFGIDVTGLTVAHFSQPPSIVTISNAIWY
jgi:hypothetical protein